MPKIESSKDEIALNLADLENRLNFRSESDKAFFKRVYATPLNIYKNRLQLLKLENKKVVLDAGCGFGQWSISSSFINDEIHALDYDFNRVRITKEISNSLNQNNMFLSNSVLEKLPFKNNTFDAITCYSVIFITDYKKSIKEFFRILKPGGIVYVVGNGIGWYLHRIITNSNSNPGFNSRIPALKTIFESIKYSFTKKRKSGSSIVMYPKSFCRDLKSVGFRNIKCEPEGHIQINKELPINPFYPPKYLGLTNIFEVLAEK